MKADYKAYSYLLLTRSLLCLKEDNVRLACVKHIASVHSKPGSNSSFQCGEMEFSPIYKILFWLSAKRWVSHPTRRCSAAVRLRRT